METYTRKMWSLNTSEIQACGWVEKSNMISVNLELQRISSKQRWDKLSLAIILCSNNHPKWPRKFNIIIIVEAKNTNFLPLLAKFLGHGIKGLFLSYFNSFPFLFSSFWCSFFEGLLFRSFCYRLLIPIKEKTNSHKQIVLSYYHILNTNTCIQ